MPYYLSYDLLSFQVMYMDIFICSSNLVILAIISVAFCQPCYKITIFHEVTIFIWFTLLISMDMHRYMRMYMDRNIGCLYVNTVMCAH